MREQRTTAGGLARSDDASRAERSAVQGCTEREAAAKDAAEAPSRRVVEGRGFEGAGVPSSASEVRPQTAGDESRPGASGRERRLMALELELVGLARGGAGLRLAIGRTLGDVERHGGVAELGFSSLEAYAVERLQRTGAWARETRAVALRLERWPEIAGALVAGRVPWSMAALCARLARSWGESRALAEAEQQTVRGLREVVQRVESGGEEPEGLDADDAFSEDERMAFSLTLTPEDGMRLEQARLLVRALGGDGSWDGTVEALLAEGEAELLARNPGLRLPETDWLDDKLRRLETYGPRAFGTSLDEARAEVEARRAPVAACDGGLPGDEPGATDSPPADMDPVTLDARLRELAAALATREAEFATRVRWFVEREGWKMLGWHSLAQWARERLGSSASAVRRLVGLGRALETMPSLRAALVSGRIGLEAAIQIGRVAHPETVEGWMRHAQHLTIKHLEEAIDVGERRARAGETERVVPPTEAQLEAAFAQETGVLRRVFDAGEAEETSAQMSRQEESGPEVSAQMSRSSGSWRARLSIRESLVARWRALERVWREASPGGGSFVGFLTGALWKSWERAMGPLPTYGDIYLRDRWRCASPVCKRRDVTPHHIVFRSQGGGDEPDNLVSLCVECHLRLLHEGRLATSGPAGNGVWRIGRKGLMTVMGRRVQVTPGESGAS